MARRFAEEGASVVVNDIDGDTADRVVAEVRGSGGAAVANHQAVGSTAVGAALVDRALSEFGRLDILVNNAGLMRDRMTHNMTDEEFDEVLLVNLRGTWACGRAALQHWRPLAKREAENGSPPVRKIINVTSASGLRGAAGQSNYAAAKMAVVGLTKTWAKEYGPLNVTCNAVAPTALTRLIEPLLRDPGQAAERLARFPLGRYGEPEEIAGTFLFLASSEADYLTGQVIPVDGGLTT